MAERNEIRTFRDLLVWQKAITLVTQVYEETRAFPKEETLPLWNFGTLPLWNLNHD